MKTSPTVNVRRSDQSSFAPCSIHRFTASLLGGALTLAIIYVRSYPLPNFASALPFAVRLHDRTTGVPYGIALAAAALLILPDTADFRTLVTPQ